MIMNLFDSRRYKTSMKSTLIETETVFSSIKLNEQSDKQSIKPLDPDRRKANCS